ncbi:MAG: carboxypeptidase regulatory-like domain-containing protein, partial [Candidatus Aminicenantes bacterium]|nr:carboxypeptidase regulatory-like domain-containing protein [Candidatus Aminicenantes bacterium]
MPISRRISFAALAIALFVRPPAAAAETALFWGQVVDAAGRGVPGARLSLRSASTGRVFATTSNDSGSFSLVGLPPGRYGLEVGGEGYETRSFPAVWLDPGGHAYQKIEWGQAPPVEEPAESRDSA